MDSNDLVSRQSTALDRKAFEQRQTPVVSIGKRDRTTGLHETIYADGSRGRSGEKIFNRVHKEGEVVRATQAGSSGLLQLDEGNTVTEYVYEAISAVPSVFNGGECRGYRNGQIFNCPDEKPKILNWQLQGSAIKIGNIYQLTDAIASQVGAMGTDRINSLAWTLSFEFQIGFGTTPYFADGIGISFTPDPLGSSGQQLGIGSLLHGFSVVIDTFNNSVNTNADRPRLQIWGDTNRETNPLADGGQHDSLRSESWQSATLTFSENKISASMGGASVEYTFAEGAIAESNAFRISASTGASNDRHSIRNIRFNRRRVRGRQ